MDPFSITAGVVGIFDSVTRLNSAISQFKDDYKLADRDLDMARQHALLLKEEIRALELIKLSQIQERLKLEEGQDCSDRTAEMSCVLPEEASFSKAISTASELLSTIEESFSLRAEPHTWRSKVRWAVKDKQTLLQVKERLKCAESTLQGIAVMEQL